MDNGFDWFTGLATIAADCPAPLREKLGLRRFFAAPNDAEFGSAVPRVLMHECLHGFQLAGSRWLQRMVAEEWERVLTLERTGQAPPVGKLRRAWGRAPETYLFSVRDLVECLARFWDVHIRGPRRILAEAGIAAASPAPDGGVAYGFRDYEAALRAGQGLDSYPRPYLQLEIAALHSPAVHRLGAADPARNPTRASWAAQLLLPIVGFVALNTDDPVPAFVLGMNAVLGDPDGLGLGTAAGNTWGLIELDWLACWAPIVESLTAWLKAEGIPVTASPAGVPDEGWAKHPVWCLHAQRFSALAEGLRHLATEPEGRPDPARPWLPLMNTMLRDMLRHHAFAACALMGIPALRLHLGAAFAPPLLRFSDTDLPATESAAGPAPWPVDAASLTMTVEATTRRHRALRDADIAAKFGLPPDAFRRTVAKVR